MLHPMAATALTVVQGNAKIEGLEECRLMLDSPFF